MLDESVQALARMLGRDRKRQDDRSRIASRWERGLWPSMTARIDCRLGCCHFLVLMFEWLTL
jgi:hypothetical protein